MRIYTDTCVIYLKRITLISFLISGTLTVEQIYQDRDKFATLVREVAAPDVGRMGIEILSFTIKVSDSAFISSDDRGPSASHASLAFALTGCV